MVWFGIAISLIILYILSLFFFKVKQMFKPKATLIIIVYNIENSIEGIIRHLNKIQRQSNNEFELIVIDKNSSDQTSIILYKLFGELGFKYFLMEHDHRSPLELGIKNATCNVIYYMEIDSDIELRITLQNFCNELKDLKSDGNINSFHGRVKKIAG